MVKCLPTVQETWVRSLGWEDPLEKEMATHFSILAWRIPWTEEPGRLQFMGSQRAGHDWVTSLTHSLTHSLTESPDHHYPLERLGKQFFFYSLQACKGVGGCQLVLG